MRFIKNSYIYFLSSIISKISPFLILPFLTSYLEPNAFGRLSIFLVINTFYLLFVGMGMQNNIEKNFSKKNKFHTATIVGNIFYIIISTTIFYSLITFIFTILVKEFFSIPTSYLLICPIIACFNATSQICLTILRSQERSYVFSLFEISNAIIVTVITLYFLIYLDAGWLSQIIGILFSSFFLFISSIIYLSYQNYFRLVLNKSKIKKIIKFSLPIIPHVLGGILINLSDRFFIEKILGLESLAIYSVAYSFGVILSIFSDAFMKAWNPWFYESLKKAVFGRKILIVKLTYFYLIITFVLAYLISLVCKNILPFIIDIKYLKASDYIWWITLGFAFQAFHKVFVPYVMFINKTKFLAYSTTTAAIINLLFNYFFIINFGLVGAAYSTSLAFIISGLMVFEYQRRNFKMPWLRHNGKLIICN